VITQLSASDLAARLASRELSAVEVAQAFMDRVNEHDHAYGAFLARDSEITLQHAREAQETIDRGEAGPLTGVPVAVKDNFSTDGIETTCASKILKGYIPPYDATVVESLRRAGCPLLGKTNLDEFAMGSSTETSAYQLSRNPWDTTRTPGGSSGGSAAAVAAELVPVSLGSDTGGSIRLPASLCGIVGFKPTYGRVSRYGLIAFGSSLDQIGPLGRSVEDVALLSSVISGPDDRDSTCLPHPAIDPTQLKTGTLRGKRFALPIEMFGEGTEAGVRQALEDACDVLRSEGAEIVEVSIPSIKLGVSTYYIIAPAEASSNLARFDGIRFGPRGEGKGHIGLVETARSQGFGHEVKTRIMIGTYALSAGYYDAFYVRAQQVRGLMRQEFNGTFQDFDAVISPTSPVVAFPLGAFDKDPLALKLLDFCTIPANMGGFPAISIPCGFSEGLPVGIQLMGPVLSDETILQLAYAAEKALPDATRRPPIP
jgi:aspartyl-tRNA(Asn)/glutamyl-tRNA(Gln) amidotransferase subunit A